MAYRNQQITRDDGSRITAGDTFSVVRSVSAPEGATIDQAWLTIKERPTDSDDDAVIQKVITPTEGDGGEIVREGGATPTENATLTFLFPATDSGDPGATPPDLVYDRTYFYDIQTQDSDDALATIESGTIRLAPGTTRAEAA